MEKINSVFDCIRGIIRLIIDVVTCGVIIIGVGYIIELNMYDGMFSFLMGVLTIYMVIWLVREIIKVFIENIKFDDGSRCVGIKRGSLDVNATIRKVKKNKIQKVQKIMRNRKNRKVKRDKIYNGKRY